MTDTIPAQSRKDKRLRRLATEKMLAEVPETVRTPLTLAKHDDHQPSAADGTDSLAGPDEDVPAKAPASLPAVTGSLPLLTKPMILNPVPVMTAEQETERERREMQALLAEQEADDIALKQKRAQDAHEAEEKAKNEAVNAVIRRKNERDRKIRKRLLLTFAVFAVVALLCQGITVVIDWIWS